MPLDVVRLRRWILAALALVVVVVLGFWLRGRLAVERVVEDATKPLGIEVQQTAEGFKLSKSEGGRTLFTVLASQAVQFKGGNRAELKDVNIVVYGRRADRFDQIYGTGFAYDRSTSEVSAQGEVHIDLEGYAEGPESPDQAPPTEQKNPIHLKTSGLVFNHETGLARTERPLEFRIPQATGSAVGATYNARTAVMTLESAVVLKTVGPQPATVSARRAVINARQPGGATLYEVSVEQQGRTLTAEQAVVTLGPRNRVDTIVLSGKVRAQEAGGDGARVAAPRAEFGFGEGGVLRSGVLSGGVEMSQPGPNPVNGRAGRVFLDFSGDNRLTRVRATDRVEMRRRQDDQQTVVLDAPAVTFQVSNGRSLERAVTAGAGRLTLLPAPGAEKAGQTVVTAGRFEAEFGARSRLRMLRGSPEAKIVSSTPGQPDKVSTSRELWATFAPAGGLATVVQEGDVLYREGQREAQGERAQYDFRQDTLTLTGTPRVTDSGVTITADSFRLERRTGLATAEGEVKTTYNEVKEQPGGALLATADPIHVTSSRMVARQAEEVARYSGGVRLWQGSSVLQAPTLEFDRERRSVVAQGTAQQRVTTSFVQEVEGKLTPVAITAEKLTYSDPSRQARFSGGVLMRGADALITARQVEVYLAARGQAGTEGAAGQIERVIAEGNIEIQQGNRKATGEKLVYTAKDGKFELTGGMPSIFDAERGKITGDSLTFFSRDDRVLVGSGTSSRTVTRTRVER